MSVRNIAGIVVLTDSSHTCSLSSMKDISNVTRINTCYITMLQNTVFADLVIKPK